MIKQGKCIVIESVGGIEKNNYIKEISSFISKKNTLVKVFSSIDQYDDILVNILSRIESSIEIDIDFITNLHLYNAVFTRILKKIKKYNEAGIDCIVTNSYINLLSNIYDYYSENNRYEEYFKILKNGIAEFKPDFSVILTTPNFKKNKKQLEFYKKVSNEIDLIIVNVDDNYQKNLNIITQFISRKKQTKNKKELTSQNIEITKTLSGYRLSYRKNIEDIYRQLIISSKEINFDFNTYDLYITEFSGLINFYLSLWSLHKKTKLEFINTKESPLQLKDEIYIPKEISPKLKKDYLNVINDLKNIYIKLSSRYSNNLEVKLLEKIIPLSLKTHSVISLDPSENNDLKNEMGYLNLAEVNKLIDNLIFDKKYHTGQKLSLEPNLLKNISDNFFGKKYDNFSNLDLKVIDFYPKNEFSILSNSLYKFSGLDFDETVGILDKLDFEQKTNILTNYISGKLDSNLYDNSFVMVECYMSIYSLRILINEQVFDEVTLQTLSPRYGYKLPSFLNSDEDINDYEKAFDLSLLLQKILSETGQEDLISYGLLWGNLVRVKIKFNLYQIKKLLKLNSFDYDNEIIIFKKQLIDQVKDKFPSLF